MKYDDLKSVIKAKLLLKNFKVENFSKYEIHMKMLYKFLDDNFIVDEISPQYVSSHIDLLVNHIIKLEVENAADYLKPDTWKPE